MSKHAELCAVYAETMEKLFAERNRAIPILTAAVLGFQKFLDCPDPAFNVIPPEGSRGASGRLLPVGGLQHKNGRWSVRFTVEFKRTPSMISPRIEVLYDFRVSFTPGKVLIRCGEDGLDREIVGNDFSTVYESILTTTEAILAPEGSLTGSENQLVSISGFAPKSLKPIST